ncbi:MAG: hypothetical protein OXC19_00990 [Bryobacterales bacterium]|nr:hypothetical protein [Bryobacterales bacterium]
MWTAVQRRSRLAAAILIVARHLMVRPIRHRAEDRVRAHIFLCLLAYYVEWHLRQALAPLLFQ